MKIKYLKLWILGSIICIIGISIMVVGYDRRDFLGFVLCVLGGGIAAGAVFRHPVGSGILSLAAGGITGYLIQEDLIKGVGLGLLLGAIIGVGLGAILRKWSQKEKAKYDEVFDGVVSLFDMNRKKTLEMNKDIETLMNESGPHIKTTKWYWTEYEYIQNRLKEVKYRRKSPQSIDNASTSYRLIREDLDRLKRSIMSHANVRKGTKKGSKGESSGHSTSLLDLDKLSKTFGDKGSRRTKIRAEDVHDPLALEKSELGKKKRIKRSNRFARFLKRKKGRPVPPEQRNAIAGFELEEQIDTHGIADVYFGKDRYGRKVAVKVPTLDKGKEWDLMTMAEFKADTKEWKGLEHDNIVKLSKSGFGPAPFVAMERVEGGDLDSLMKNHVFDMGEVINIFAQLLKGLSYAHKKKVIHMDLKPENILFDEKGTAKISDWCLDNFLVSQNPDKLKGDKKRLIYSAPEQIRPKEFGKPDKSTDIFRLGVIFYEILTKKKPFYDEEPARIESMITVENPPPPSSLNPEVPTEFDSIIMRALEKEKKKRWQSADEMYEKLDELMKD